MMNSMTDQLTGAGGSVGNGQQQQQQQQLQQQQQPNMSSSSSSSSNNNNPNNNNTSNGDNKQQTGSSNNKANLIVNYLPQSVKEQDFNLLFSKIGAIKSCKLMFDRQTGWKLFLNFFEKKIFFFENLKK